MFRLGWSSYPACSRALPDRLWQIHTHRRKTKYTIFLRTLFLILPLFISHILFQLSPTFLSFTVGTQYKSLDHTHTRIYLSAFSQKKTYKSVFSILFLYQYLPLSPFPAAVHLYSHPAQTTDTTDLHIAHLSLAYVL